jgi:HK97 family phage portal protein
VGLLTAAFNPVPPKATPSDLDDFWYTPDVSSYVLQHGSAGFALSADSILNCGTVLAAVRFRGDSWAMCPPSTFRKTSRGRQDVPDHYSQRVLRNPAPWITGNRWRHLMGVWMATWGNGYAEIRASRDSFVGALWPMHPSRVRVVDQRSDGVLVYEYRRPETHAGEILGQERVLHFRDLSTDGISGAEMYKLIRNVVSIALLAEQHAATFLRKGARIAGLLVPTAPLQAEQRKELRDSVNRDMSGPNMTGALGILPHGIDLKPLSLSNRDNQITELADQVIGAILRFLGVPGVVVGWADKTATYASAEAFFEKGGIKHCVLPILTNAEAEEERALLVEDEGLQIKHNLDALERSNLAGRYEAYSKALGGAPWLSVNDVRLTEDWTEDPDPRHREVRIPVNLMPPEPPPEPDDEEPPVMPPTMPGSQPPSPQDEPENEQAPIHRLTSLARAWATEAAARCIRRETAAIRREMPKLARYPPAWRSFVLRFYEKHAPFVSQAMLVPESTARKYCDQQAEALLEGGAAVIETWERDVPAQLVDLALEEAC